MKEAQVRPWCQWNPWGQGALSLAGTWGLESGRASHMGAANAVRACVSLSSWSLRCSNCQHPYFGWPNTVAWEEETLNGSVVMQPADECVGVWLHSTAKAGWRWKHAYFLIQGCIAKAEVKHRAWGSCLLVGSSGMYEVGDNPIVIWVTHDWSAATTQHLACHLEQFWYNRVVPPLQGLGRTSVNLQLEYASVNGSSVLLVDGINNNALKLQMQSTETLTSCYSVTYYSMTSNVSMS